MKTIHHYLLSTAILLLTALPTMAQSTRLDSLLQVKQGFQHQFDRIELEYDSIYSLIAQCTTDDQRKVHLAVRDKIERRQGKLSDQFRRIEDEIKVEKARLEHIEREARLAEKQAQAQAKSPVPLKGELAGHQWVDLGLPSGTKWATYNVGTTLIHGVGTRIAWGELATKKTFSPSAYKYNDTVIISYTGNAECDLATAQWGEGWYTPTKLQWDELIKYCDWEYVMINGIYGVLFTSTKTYNYIFLPSTGYTDDETYKLKYTTYNLAYWSSTGYSNNGAHAYIANYEQGYMTITNRYVAHCVRAVCGLSCELASAAQNTADVVQTIQETVSAVQQTPCSAASLV